MARYPNAQWHPSPNYSTGNNPRIYVLHIMQGSLAGTDQWFTTHAAQAQASAHFGIGKDGTVIQWVDTANASWNCVSGNHYTIGVEHEGFAGQELTAAQLAADRKLAAWCQKVHGIPLTPTDSISGHGTGWHGMGGAGWGGHNACPGAPIVAQRGLIDAPSAAPSPQKWVTGGKRSLVALAVYKHMMASTILRHTLQAAKKIPAPLAAYINGGDLSGTLMASGITLYLDDPPENLAAPGKGGVMWVTEGKASLAGLCARQHVAMSTVLRETIARYDQFDDVTAHYLSAGDLKHTLIPAGAQLWIPPASP